MDLSHINFSPPLPKQYLPVQHLLRRHTDGTFEIIVCLRETPLRFYGSTEDAVYKQAAKHLGSRG
jgi:hypothetical protein